MAAFGVILLLLGALFLLAALLGVKWPKLVTSWKQPDSYRRNLRSYFGAAATFLVVGIAMITLAGAPSQDAQQVAQNVPEKPTAAKAVMVARKDTHAVATEKPVSPTVENNAAIAADDRREATGIGLSYDQVTAHLKEYMPMSRAHDVRGQPRYMGRTADNLAMLEVIGVQADISRATLMIGVPTDLPRVLSRNTVFALRFMKNVAPRWPSRADWLNTATQRANQTDKPVIAAREDRTITVEIFKPLGLVSITVEPTAQTDVSRN